MSHVRKKIKCLVQMSCVKWKALCEMVEVRVIELIRDMICANQALRPNYSLTCGFSFNHHHHHHLAVFYSILLIFQFILL